MSFEREEQPILIFKIALIGIKGVGKTAYAKSLYPLGVTKFDDHTKLTIGLDFYTYDYSLKSRNIDEFIRYSIWSFNPENRFKLQFPYYVHGSNAILIMFDVSNPTSLNPIDNWMQVIKKSEKCPIFLLGNKADLKQHIKSAKIRANSLVKKYQFMAYYEISALKSWNIESIFDDLTNYFLRIFPFIKERKIKE
jgi:small GTP-binding protein